MRLKLDSSKKNWQRAAGVLWPYIAPYRGRVTASISCMFLAVAMRIVEPWPLQIVIDHVLVPQYSTDSSGPERSLSDLPMVSTSEFEPITVLSFCVLAIVVVAVIGAVADYARAVGFAWIGNRVVTELRRDVFRHLQSLSLAFHTRSRTGDLTVRLVGDLNMIRDVAVTALLPLVASITILIGMFGIMLWLHWRLALLAIAVFPLFWISATRGSRKIHAAAKKQRSCEGALAATASESLTSVKVVQAMSLEHRFTDTFGVQSQKSMRDGVKTSRLSAALERKVDVLIALASAMVLWQGARYVMAGSLSIGGLVVFLTYLKRGFKPLQSFAKYTGRLSKSMAAADRVIEILEESPDVHEADNARVAMPFKGRIEFRNVTFGYSKKHPTLENVSFVIEPGERIAIIGSSGAGKSTLLSLICRLHDPSRGSIAIDGHDIREWTLRSLRSQQSLVMQDNAVFATSVSENIALVNPNASQESIENAAKIAGADEFIRRLPDGYQTPIGERGANLSRGQVQRLAIARASLLSTPILLIDEPTTGLDEANERLVIDGILRASTGRTTLIVTHELTLAAKADRIIVLHDGQVVEVGTHAELMAEDGRYARMQQSQQDVRSTHALQK